MQPKLKELIQIREEEMMNIDCSYDTFKRYRRYWNEFLNYSEKQGYEFYNEKIYINFLKDVYNYTIGNNPNRKQSYAIRAKAYLENSENFISKCKSTNDFKYPTYKLTEYFENILQKYIDECKNNYNSEATLRQKEKGLSKILKYFEDNNIYNFDHLSKDIIIKLFNNYKNLLYMRKEIAWLLRGLFTFLYNEKITKINYSIYVPVIKRNRREKLPTVFSTEDVSKIVNYMKTHNNTNIQKRNHAMLILAIRYGMRISDIKNLKFENINWEENYIGFNQVKTGNYMKLPLTNEVGNFIIDYIKNSRPSSLENYIFLRYTFPHIKISGQNNIREYIIKICQKLNIDLSNKEKIGIHCFRSTLASNMLKNEIPVNIISQILGHENTDTTSVYIRIDENRLKDCFLELPHE